MNDLVSAFLKKFEHPIMYSVLTSLAIWNFDFIYLLSIAPFHIYEIDPYTTLFELSQELSVNTNDRIIIPIIKGALFGAFIPSLLDITYSTLVSYAMSFKEMGIRWGERTSWRYKIEDSRETAISLAHKLENYEFLELSGLFSEGSKLLAFRNAPFIEKDRVVTYNAFTNQIEYPSGKEMILGLVYEVLPNNISLVITSGNIFDKNFINKFAIKFKSAKYCKIAKDGKLLDINDAEQETKKNAYLKFVYEYGNSEIIESIQILQPTQDIHTINLPLSTRLFGVRQ